MIKYLITLFTLIIFTSCINGNSATDNDIRKFITKDIGEICKNSTIYFLHPETCGACSVKLLKKISNETENNNCTFILSTGDFSNEYDSIISKMTIKIHYIKGDKYIRKGISSASPHLIKIVDYEIKESTILNI